MKILTVVYSLGIGGTERVAENYSVAFGNRGHKVKVLVTEKPGRRQESLAAEGIDVLNAAEGPIGGMTAAGERPVKGGNEAEGPIGGMNAEEEQPDEGVEAAERPVAEGDAAEGQVAGVNEAEQPDKGVNTAESPSGGDLFGKHLEEIKRWSPDLVHLHSHELDPADVYRLHNALPDALFIETNVFSTPGKYAGCVDISFQLTEWCRWIYECRARRYSGSQKVAVGANLVNPDPFYYDEAAGSSFRERVGIPDGATLLCRVGQPIESKWSPALIGLFESAARRFPDLCLYLVGAPRSVQDRIERLPEDIKKRVWTRRADLTDAELRGVYSGSDLFCHIAAVGESFGMVLCEAMLCECPPVTFSTPGRDNSQAEVVCNETGGLVCTTLEGYEQALVALIQDKDLRSELGKNGRRRVLEQYTSGPVLDRILDEIARLKSARQNGGGGQPGRSTPNSGSGHEKPSGANTGPSGVSGDSRDSGAGIQSDSKQILEIYSNVFDRPDRLVRLFIILRKPFSIFSFKLLGERIWVKLVNTYFKFRVNL